MLPYRILGPAEVPLLREPATMTWYVILAVFKHPLAFFGAWAIIATLVALFVGAFIRAGGGNGEP